MSDLDWQDHAACIGLDPDLFFPVKHAPGNAREAKAVCAICPVRQQCADYAVDNGIRHGIWGGANRNELLRLRRVRRLAS